VKKKKKEEEEEEREELFQEERGDQKNVVKINSKKKNFRSTLFTSTTHN